MVIDSTFGNDVELGGILFSFYSTFFINKFELTS